jgi:hypothetical protein
MAVDFASAGCRRQCIARSGSNTLGLGAHRVGTRGSIIPPSTQERLDLPETFCVAADHAAHLCSMNRCLMSIVRFLSGTINAALRFAALAAEPESRC